MRIFIHLGFWGAILGLALISCRSSHSTPMEVQVWDALHDQPLDSAVVLLQRAHSEGKWTTQDSLWSDEAGKLSFELRPDEGYRYRLRAERNHYQSILDESGARYRNEAPISLGDTNRLKLELEPIVAPDPERFSRIYAELNVQQLIAAMRSDTWEWNFLPRLAWTDVPALLEVGGDSAFMHTYPHHPRTTYQPDSVRVGLTALWLIEAIRRQDDPQERPGGMMPPSRAPVLGTRYGNPQGFNSVEQLQQAHQAYQQWWASHQDDLDQAERTNPLRGQGLSWM